MAKSKLKEYPIYVIVGKDDSLLNAQCEKLLNQLLPPSRRAIAFFQPEPDQVSASQVLDELRTIPFLTEKRVVVLKGADKFISKNRQLLEKYFDNPCPTAILILTVNDWPSQTKLAKKLTKTGKLISVTQPRAYQLPTHLIKYTQEKHHKVLTKDAAELLIELAGDNLSFLYNEIDKLALFANSEKTLTVQHIESLIGHNRLFNAFAVIDAVTSGNASEAINRLRNMFAEDKSAQYTVVGAFAFHFRKLFQAKALLAKGVSSSQIFNTLQIWRDRNSYIVQLNKMTLEQIGSILQELAAIDYALKTGQAKAEVAMEQLIIKITTGFIPNANKKQTHLA